MFIQFTVSSVIWANILFAIPFAISARISFASSLNFNPAIVEELAAPAAVDVAVAPPVTEVLPEKNSVIQSKLKSPIPKTASAFFIEQKSKAIRCFAVFYWLY